MAHLTPVVIRHLNELFDPADVGEAERMLEQLPKIANVVSVRQFGFPVAGLTD